MPKLPTQSIRDQSEGIIQAVDSSIRPPNSVYLAVNFLFDKILGRAVLRPGITQLGSQIRSGKTCLGLYDHITSTGTKVPLALFNNTDDATAILSKYTASAWSNAKTGLTASAKMRFETFLDTTIGVNGTDKISSADGSSWVTTGGDLDIGNAPAGTLVKEFLDKLYIAGVSGNLDRLYFSSVPTAGAISWTVDNGYIDIEPEEGTGPITALAKVPGYLLIFKNRSLKRWDGVSTYPESMIKLGTFSQDSVVETRQSVFYFNQKGIFETVGSYPRKISRRIQDIIDAIPASSYASIAGYGDNERVYFHIGNITIGDLALANCVITYHLDSQTWTLLSFPKSMRKWSKYILSTEEERLITGDADGNVWQILQGVDDAGTDINWLMQYHALEFGSRGRTKSLSKFVFYTKNVINGSVSVRVDEFGDFKPIGNINKTKMEVIKDLTGSYFEFRIQGKGKAASIIGIDFPELDLDLNYTQ